MPPLWQRRSAIKFYRILALSWHWLLAGAWKIREKLNLPFTVSVGQGKSIRLFPVGQIARCLYCESYEADERTLVARSLKVGMTMIDIGANIGLYSLIADKLVGPSGVILSIEPSEETFQRLLNNQRLNNASRVKPLKTALGASDDQSMLLVRETGKLDGEKFVAACQPDIALEADIENVSVVTLDTLCRRNGITQVDFIKMDVEGGEYAVLQGARDLLASNPHLLMVFEHTRPLSERAGHRPDAIPKMLAEFGFRLYGWDAQAKDWTTSYDFILTHGNAWATTNPESLPRV